MPSSVKYEFSISSSFANSVRLGTSSAGAGACLAWQPPLRYRTARPTAQTTRPRAPVGMGEAMVGRRDDAPESSRPKPS
eukprot:2808116-Amphidinium_carterae.1